MTYLELCPVCQRGAKELVGAALDFTAIVRGGDYPRICSSHLPLVFSSLGYPTMAAWLDRMLAEHSTVGALMDDCPLCTVERNISPSAEELRSQYLCPAHGGPRGDTLALIRAHLQRIADGEKVEQQRFILRAALIYYASIRGTSPMVRID